MLATHFLAQAVTKNNLQPKRMAPAALRVMAAQTWNGNVRALKNVVEQAAIMSDGPVIGPDDLPFNLAPASLEPRPEPSLDAPIVRVPKDWIDLKAAVKTVTELTETEIIGRALSENGGNRTRAAQALGLSRRALITKIALYNLDPAANYKSQGP
jgi:two-component system response regulator AtoC